MKLSPRLKVIADLVPNNSKVADIGTDHGFIPVYLIKNEISKKVIATDVNEGPIENAENTIKLYKLENKIETRMGNGLKPIKPNEIDTVIIAGMGGLLIKDILSESKEVVATIETFILQPMVAQDELRKWLEGNGFKIQNEKLAKEGNKFYEIIVVKKGKMEIKDEIYYEIGPKLIENRDPYLKEFLLYKIKKYEKIYNGVKYEQSSKAMEKKEECIEKIKKMQEVLKCL